MSVEVVWFVVTLRREMVWVARFVVTLRRELVCCHTSVVDEYVVWFVVTLQREMVWIDRFVVTLGLLQIQSNILYSCPVGRWVTVHCTIQYVFQLSGGPVDSLKPTLHLGKTLDATH